LDFALPPQENIERSTSNSESLREQATHRTPLRQLPRQSKKAAPRGHFDKNGKISCV
jgi:hypothetical protein